ncbi:MAG: fumarate hydratase, partial [Candidatus Omnitrophota bacterium]
MRKINVSRITDAVEELCIKANFELRTDILAALKKAFAKEKSRLGASIIRDIIENARIAKKEGIAICQDTGMVAVFLEIGREVALTGGDLSRAVNEGVKRAYKTGCLRRSIVADPLIRKNTGTNTPCVIHTDIVEGRSVRIAVSPKGFGSENKSRMIMFRPTAAIDEIKRFVVDTVKNAGASACPPLIVGV